VCHIVDFIPKMRHFVSASYVYAASQARRLANITKRVFRDRELDPALWPMMPAN
jgi:hypothetical protein